MNELPIPYGDKILIEPVEDVGIVGKTLNWYGKVLAIGPEVISVKVGEYVAFEKWDMREVPLKNDTFCRWIRETDVGCSLPLTLL